MTARRLSDADLAALESVDEPLRVTAVADLVAALRAERAKSERVEQENERLRSMLNRRIEGDEAERAVTARLRGVLAAVEPWLDNPYSEPEAFAAFDAVRAALAEPEG